MYFYRKMLSKVDNNCLQFGQHFSTKCRSREGLSKKLKRKMENNKK